MCVDQSTLGLITQETNDIYTGCGKKVAPKVFSWHILRKICDKIITKDPTTPKVCCYTTLCGYVFKQIQ